MKVVNTLFSAVLLWICISCQNQTTEIYVSAIGDDTASGAKDSPVKSILKARDLSITLVKEGPVDVIFEDGTYYLSGLVVFEASHSGTKENPITYKVCN